MVWTHVRSFVVPSTLQTVIEFWADGLGVPYMPSELLVVVVNSQSPSGDNLASKMLVVAPAGTSDVSTPSMEQVASTLHTNCVAIWGTSSQHSNTVGTGVGADVGSTGAEVGVGVGSAVVGVAVGPVVGVGVGSAVVGVAVGPAVGAKVGVPVGLGVLFLIDVGGTVGLSVASLDVVGARVGVLGGSVGLLGLSLLLPHCCS